jgi:hypothetical protein
MGTKCLQTSNSALKNADVLKILSPAVVLTQVCQHVPMRVRVFFYVALVGVAVLLLLGKQQGSMFNVAGAAYSVIVCFGVSMGSARELAKKPSASWYFELSFGFLALSLFVFQFFPMREISEWTKTAFSNWSFNTTAEFVFSRSFVSTQFGFASVALYVLFCMAITAFLVFYGVIFTIVNRIHEPK